jgi:phosphatidylserine/phosphatidylglycerophosphate/cardiolipin synthase-like enzyme
MSEVADSRHQLVRILVELARELPPGTLNALISESQRVGGSGNLSRFAATQGTRERLRRLEELSGQCPEIDAQVMAFALRVAGEAAAAVAAEHHAEIAWTGPATEAVPLRRVDQVIYDMVETAQQEVLLVTYAAYKAERALEVLRDATDRRVRVKLVIELAKQSGRKITFDGLQAFRTAVPKVEIYYWPLERRQRSASGSYGAMHAKCLVADRRRAIVSSANLTDYALEVNMELGLLVGQVVAARLAEHFDHLIVRRELIPVVH